MESVGCQGQSIQEGKRNTLDRRNWSCVVYGGQHTGNRLNQEPGTREYEVVKDHGVIFEA